MIRVLIPGRRMRRVASIPSIFGIRMSISTTSGRTRRATSTASSPVPASPTTRRSGAVSTRTRKPARTSTWSSATRTETLTRRHRERQPGADPVAAAGQRPGAELAAVQGDPLAHPDQPVPGGGQIAGLAALAIAGPRAPMPSSVTSIVTASAV